MLTDFVSLPPAPASTMRESSIFKTSSHSLITLVRRGMSEKRSPQESFALAEQCHSINGDAKSAMPDPDEEEKDPAAFSPQRPSKKSCLKVNRSPDIRAVSFDATAVKERAAEAAAAPNQSLSLPEVDTTESAAATAVLTMAAAATTPSSTSRLQLRHVQNCNERRRIFEDNLAAVCMGFVLVFLVCHFPRLLLNIHELITIREAMKCGEKGHHPFSVWSMVTIR